MSRRGKYLTIYFNSGDNLVLHLRMTGQLLMPPLIIRWIVKHSLNTEKPVEWAKFGDL